MFKQPRQHNEKHLAFIRTLPCVCCHNDIETQAAHIRFSDAAANKVNAGVAAKPDDRWTLPLCGPCHAAQHDIGDERHFWNLAGINPLVTAEQLYAVSGNFEQGCKIVKNASVSELSKIMAAG